MVEGGERARRELAEKLNLETARLGWDELARHFARGSVIRVAATLWAVVVAPWVLVQEAREA